jgi:hypothetical protein
MSVVKLEQVVLLSPDEIKKDQDSIRRNLTKLDAQIHSNAVQCLMHCEKHRDTSLMRRLLVDIIDAKSGYRRQGLIVWMRMFSPMELSGDTINMSGKDKDGKERAFDIEKARQSPFWGLREAREIVRPLYQESWLGKINAAEREFRRAIENTKDGKPIDPTKPFYDGVGADKIVSFFDKIAEMKTEIPADSTREVRMAQETIRKAEMAEQVLKTA